MLKFGNTYLNFGGTYLTGWDYHKEPVIENGWSELYNINSYKELTSSNSADDFENELNHDNFKNLALRSFTANYVPTVGG